MSPGIGADIGRVFVVGSVNQDFVLKVLRRPEPGETVTDAELSPHPGGKGANQAVAAALLGARVSMLGRVGDDPFGEGLVDNLRDRGIDASRLRRVPDAPTGAAFITVTPDGENAITVAPGANLLLTPEDVRDAAPEIARSDVLVAQMEIPADTVACAARVAEAGRTRLVLNLAPAGRLPESALRLADPLVVNEHEASALLRWHVSPGPHASWRIEHGMETAERLLGLGPRSVVVTLGAAGAVVATASAGESNHGVSSPRDKAQHFPAPATRVVDTTGAGDAFVGALACGLAGGASLGEAVDYSARAAAAAVTREGAQAAMPTPEALDDVL